MNPNATKLIEHFAPKAPYSAKKLRKAGLKWKSNLSKAEFEEMAKREGMTANIYQQGRIKSMHQNGRLRAAGAPLKLNRLHQFLP